MQLCRATASWSEQDQTCGESWPFGGWLEVDLGTSCGRGCVSMTWQAGARSWGPHGWAGVLLACKSVAQNELQAHLAKHQQ